MSKIIKINNNSVETLGDLVFSLNSKSIEFIVPLKEGNKYIEAKEKLIRLTENCRSEEDGMKIMEYMYSNKYIKPIITVKCNNAAVTYLNTMVDRFNKIEEKLKINIHLGYPTVVSYEEKTTESNIILETIIPNENYMVYPKYKFKYIKD